MLYLYFFWKEVFTGEPLRHRDLYYWNEVAKRYLAPWEAQAIIQIDRCYWTVKSEESK